MDTVTRGLEEDEDDPFLEVDTRQDLHSLIEKTMSDADTCTLDEYLSGDSDIPICKELDTSSSAGWEEAFLAQLQEEEGSESDKDDTESDNEDLGDSVPPVKLKSLKEVIQCLEDAQHFLEHRGHLEHALRIGQNVDDIVSLKTTSAKKSSIYM